jgi:hypothetical protein
MLLGLSSGASTLGLLNSLQGESTHTSEQALASAVSLMPARVPVLSHKAGAAGDMLAGMLKNDLRVDKN